MLFLNLFILRAGIEAFEGKKWGFDERNNRFKTRKPISEEPTKQKLHEHQREHGKKH